MHLIDTTMFFGARSGGVKRYLTAKQRWLAAHTPSLSHTVLVPSAIRANAGTVSCSAMSVPLRDGYRFPLSIKQWSDALNRMRPDVIEAADPYVPGIAARRVGRGLGIPIVAFCHSDVPGL